MILALVGAAGCSGAGLGQSCTTTGQCDSDLQCFQGFCAPPCVAHVDCGDGYRCDPSGQCEQVISAVGDPCEREIDCGPGQTCALDQTSGSSDQTLTGTCESQATGAVTGASCSTDSDCQTGLCAIGRCSELCSEPSDCPPALTCAAIPLVSPDGARFSGCLPATGVITEDLALSSPSSHLALPVPSNARSVALVAQVDQRDQLVGVDRVLAPSGRTLYTTPVTVEDFYANPIRYRPSPGVSTLLVPNSPNVPLEVGVYQIDVSSHLPLGGLGTALPHVRLVYKVDDGAALDLHFYFLDLSDHPCASSFDGGELDAAHAPSSARFQNYVHHIEGILGQANIQLGEVTYQDLTDRGDLDSIDRSQLGQLLSLATRPTGVNVFVVRSISPVGVQSLSGATPGPPLTPGTSQSGIAVGMDTLCYRSWDQLARITAHTLARQMGLFENRDPTGHLDPIPDSDDGSDNLLFFSEFGGTMISPQQGDILRRFPGLQ